MVDVPRAVELRVTVGDDRGPRSHALADLLRDRGIEVVGAAGRGGELLKLSIRSQPDVIVLEPSIAGDLDGSLLPRLLDGVPGAHVVVGGPVSLPPGRPSHRVSAVASLDPALVAALVETLVPRRRGVAAVVCLGDGPFHSAVVSGLARLGVAPVTVAGPVDAVAAIRRGHPQLLVIDLSLTGMGGWTYLQGLATDHPGCRVVVISPLGVVPLAALEVGAVAVLAEGDIAGLRTVVREVLESSQSSSGPGHGASPPVLPSAGNRRRNAPSS